MDELDRVVAQAVGAQIFAGAGEPGGGGIDGGEMGGGMRAEQGREGTAVAFAHEQDAARRGSGAAGGAAALELFAGKEPFDPALVRGKALEAH